MAKIIVYKEYKSGGSVMTARLYIDVKYEEEKKKKKKRKFWEPVAQPRVAA